MKLGIYAAAIVASTNPTLAAAFEFGGASLEYSYRDAEFNSQQQLSGSAAFSFGNAFGAEVGLKHAIYDNGLISNGGEVHLTYGFGGGFTLGVFYGGETFDTDNYQYYGTEAAFVTGSFAAQTSISRYHGDSYDATNFTLDGEYSFGDQFGVLAGYHNVNDATDSTNYLFAGASYSFAPSFAVKATYGRLDYNSGTDDTVATLGLTYNFGGGATFNQRTYTEILPTD